MPKNMNPICTFRYNLPYFTPGYMQNYDENPDGPGAEYVIQDDCSVSGENSDLILIAAHSRGLYEPDVPHALCNGG